MKKIVYIISDTDKSLQFEWIAKGMQNAEMDQQYILLHNTSSELERYLVQNNIPVHRVSLYSGLKLLFTFFEVFSLLRKIKPNIVHYHLLKASIIGSFCAYFLRIEKRVLTRHHSNYHRVYATSGQKWDRLINRFSTHIIAISENVKNELVIHENINKNKITIIHHGLDFKYLNAVSEEEVAALKSTYQLNDSFPIIGAISRYEELKGVNYIIEGFHLILSEYPNAKLVLANAKGNIKSEIQTLLEQHLETYQYVEIEFEPNVFALYKCFDVFVHVPIDGECEAFGQTYIEPLAIGVPSVFTLSGVAHEFIKDNKYAVVVPYKNAQAIANGMKNLLEIKNKTKFIEQGKQVVLEKFKIEHTIHEHIKLYLNSNG